MTLRWKLALTFLAVLLLAGLQAGVAVVLLTQVADGSAQLVQPALTRVDTAAHLEDEMLHLQRLVETQGDAAQPAIQAERGTIDTLFEQYRRQTLDGQRARLLESVFEQYQQPTPDFAAMETQLHQLRHLEYAVIEQLRGQLVVTAEWARWPLAIAIVLVAAGELILGWSLSHRIMGSLALLRNGARRIAQETGIEPIPTPPEPEFADLAATLNEVMLELAANRTAQRQLEAERARLHRAQLGQVVRIQEEERARISRELHDQAGQALTALRYGLDHLQRQYRDPVARQQVADLVELATVTGHQISALARDLRPAVLDDLGLLAALRSYSREYSERVGIPVHIAAPGSIPRLGADAETALFRVVQEALTNVAKHAAASHVWIDVSRHAERLEVRVRDDGQGFDTGRLDVGRHVGLGLAGIEERVQLLGGNFEVQSRPGDGTSIQVSIPLANTLESTEHRPREVAVA